MNFSGTQTCVIRELNNLWTEKVHGHGQYDRLNFFFFVFVFEKTIDRIKTQKVFVDFN